jgi:excisionase family DNA binding protein
MEWKVQKLLLSINDTAHALSLGRTKVYELIAAGRLETVKVGRRTLVPVASVLAFTTSL